MRTSLIAGLTMAFLSISQANDQISLKNGDLFFGKVIALKGGLIELQTPHSEAPLKILNKDLIKLNFSADYSEKETPDELPKNSQELYLRNGDSIPGEVVGLTPTHLSFQTWFAGLLEIPREQIDSVFFGRMFGELMGYLGEDGISTMSGMPFAIYHVWDEENKTAKIEVAIANTSEMPETDRIKKGMTHEGNVLKAVKTGSYETGDEHWGLEAYAELNNKEIVGSPWEIFATDPTVEEIVVEVYYPVK
jgi:effector-binding domain-containing protein